MGRRFTRASNEYVAFGSGGLAGFNFTFGTWAAWLNVAAYPGGGSWASIASTNLGVGAVFESELLPTPSIDLWDGTNDRTTTGPTAGVTTLIGFTKATGSVVGRYHSWVPSTNLMTHAALSGASVNGATLTSLTYGNESTSATNGPFDGDIFEMAFWQGLAMSDQEFERLARWKDWGRFAPNFWQRESDGREVGDISRTLGRYRSKQTARSGTTRGVASAPAGFGSSVYRRRS